MYIAWWRDLYIQETHCHELCAVRVSKLITLPQGLTSLPLVVKIFASFVRRPHFLRGEGSGTLRAISCFS